MVAEHLARSFDDELKLLEQSLLDMGRLALSQLLAALSNLAQSDKSQVDKIIEGDSKIDELNELVDRQAVRLLALRQPMGGDLRVIVSSLRIASELERMGDYAVGLAKRARIMGHQNQEALHPEIIQLMRRLGDKVAAQISLMLRAMENHDQELAVTCWASDQEIDEVYSALHHKIVAAMSGLPGQLPGQSADRVAEFVQLLFMAKHIERIGDHITNIAEAIYFSISGDRLTDPRPKSDTSYALS
ncbi:MAG: phosphate signaling complex protein PhoU [Candidatus Symbiobacter sp.]|nr:phosphate signaling complex protein PhoU [Candidatus Symbiobacter sp.]